MRLRDSFIEIFCLDILLEMCCVIWGTLSWKNSRSQSQKKLWIEDFLNNLLINISDFIFSCVVNPVTLHEESNPIKRNVFENFYIKRNGQALWKILIKEFVFLFKSRLRPRPADLLKLSFVTTTSIRVWGKCSNCN